MRHIATTLTFTAIFLSACNNSKPTEAGTEDETQDFVSTIVETEQPKQIEYANADARMHGLLGKVSHVTSTLYCTYEEGTELKEGGEYKSYELRFDKWGHVVRDQWCNEYGYDAEGNYYRGKHTYTKVKRDKQGRIVNYMDEEPTQDNERNSSYEFKYSNCGQLVAVSGVSGLTTVWEEAMVYKDSSIFPESTTRKATIKGEGEEVVTTTTTSYKYSSKDERGNWIDRTCIVNEQTTRTVLDVDTLQSEEKTENTTTTTIYIEKRVIDYYE